VNANAIASKVKQEFLAKQAKGVATPKKTATKLEKEGR
jgi:hypothetical protein